MSLIAHTFLPRSMFDYDVWFRPQSLGLGPSTLDLFDPFDDLDRAMGRNLLWLTKPFAEEAPLAPRVPNKYRITLDVSGYSPKSIKTEVKDNKLYITGSEGAKHDSDDFSVREFRKSYKLPANAETDKLASFVTSNGTLVVEVPLKTAPAAPKSDLLPRVVTEADGKKRRVELNVALPEGIDPAKINVTCKDRDIIIKTEAKSETDAPASVFYYRRSTLPENTDFGALKCVYDDAANRLAVGAPLLEEFPAANQRNIPVEFAAKAAAVAGATAAAPANAENQVKSQ